MIGAGFSRNAKPIASSTLDFPNWHNLGDIFFKKLHGRYPCAEVRYLSVPKLAEQIQAAFGRPALDNLLKQTIPDRNYEASSLHKQLLKLPWKDVFTTNYDTLLERACASVTLRRYDVVTTETDLLYANAPRIVKLHGSFRTGPFVITEEDYRRFPQDHAPLVNTVCQSLLENILCLIGFSGDDPNFLKWIGWIRDHFGEEAAARIYLIGIFDSLSEPERNLLTRRGIVLINLSAFGSDPTAALDRFLNYLNDRKLRAVDWPIVPTDVPLQELKTGFETYPDIVKEWRRQRFGYPGWVVMPADRRAELWRDTQPWLLHLSQISQIDRAKFETPLDLDLAFELLWRLDRCLFPLIDELTEWLTEIVSKYSDSTPRLPEQTHWTETSMFEAVVNIRLWLLRHYREKGLVKEWQNVNRSIETDFANLSSEHRARFRLEEALQALFHLDPPEAKRLLINWQSNESLPFLEAKHATLMAELGEVKAAQSILEAALSNIRQQLSLNPVVGDYTLVSQESIVMLLLWSVERSRFWNGSTTNSSSLLDDLSERWNELALYKCDPRREIQSLSAKLSHKPIGWQQESKTYSFDLGVIKIFRLGSDRSEFADEVISGHAMLRMYEDFGVPYRLEQTPFLPVSIKQTLSRVRPRSPHWALVNFVRLGDVKVTDGLFDREYLNRLSRDEIDSFVEIYLPAFDRTIAMVDKPEWSDVVTVEALAKTLPEMFSRLCNKCSPKHREHLVSVLRAIYNSRRRQVFKNVDLFAKRLFQSMSITEQVHAVPSLLDFPMPGNLGEYEKGLFVNPILFVDQSVLIQRDAIQVTGESIDALLNHLERGGSDRDWTLTKLIWLHIRDKLNEPQSERLGELLWDGVEPSDVPMVTGFRSFTCLKLPSPSGVNTQSLIKNRIRTKIASEVENNQIEDIMEELHKSAGVVEWSQAQASDLATILSEWWKKNSCFLHHHSQSTYGLHVEQIKRSTSKMIDTLSAVYSHMPVNQKYGNSCKLPCEFLTSLKQNNIPMRRLEVAVLGAENTRWERAIELVAADLIDNDQDVVFDALQAARIMARALSAEELRSKFAPVGKILVQGVQWRHQPLLPPRLRVVADLIKSQPWFLSKEMRTALLAGLKKIAESTSNGMNGNDEDGVIATRAAGAALAYALFPHWQELPDEIKCWQEICSDPNEFAEVRNAWRNID